MLAATDQWGLYHVGDRAFASKLEAIQYQRQCGLPLTWHYQELEFAQHDWTQEPTQSLWELYSERAHQLRQQYQYIILLYSGGADSENVLQAFERNGIMVDEIRIAYAGDYTDANSLRVLMNLELHHVAIPRARALQTQWPNLKVTVVGMDDMIEQSLNDYTNDSLHFGNNMSWSLWQRQRFGMTKKQSHTWMPQLQGDHQIAILWGKDKTFVNKVNGRYAVQFIDRHLNGNLEPLPDNCQHEYFYWGKDCAQILIKQGHVLKNFYRQADYVSTWFTDNQKYILPKWDHKWHYNTVDVAGKRTMINNGCYNTLIYPWYNCTTFDVGKIEWQVASQSMRVMLQQNPAMQQSFDRYVEACKALCGPDWLDVATWLGNSAHGPKAISGRPWYLEA